MTASAPQLPGMEGPRRRHASGSLERHHLRQLFAIDGAAALRALSVSALDFLYDFTRQRLTPNTMALLLALARDCGLEERIAALFAGEAVNHTERRAAMHMALRNRPSARCSRTGRT